MTPYVLPFGRAQKRSMRGHEHGLRSCNSWGTWIVLRFCFFCFGGGDAGWFVMGLVCWGGALCKENNISLRG